MAYSFGNNGVIICHNTIRYNGEKIPNPPNFKDNNHNITVINNHFYVNGWEYDLKKKKWKRSLAALWHLIF